MQVFAVSSEQSPSFTILCIQRLQTSGNYVAFQHFFPPLFGFFFFFVSSASKCSAFTGPLSSSILFTCPNHRSLCSLRNFSNLSEFSSCLFYLSRFSHISFATCWFLQSSTSFHLPLSTPNIQHHNLKHFSHSFCRDHVFSVRPCRRHLFHCCTFSAQIVSAPIRCSLTVHLIRVWARVRALG